MNSTSSGLSDLLQRALSEYPVDQIGEGLTEHLAREVIERRIPERIQNSLSDENLIVKASAGQGRWTAIPWIAILDSRETTQIQEGVYIVYLFEPRENRVTLSLNQGVTHLKDDLGINKAREKLNETAEMIRNEIQPRGFTGGSLQFPHASNRNKLYGPGTIFYKRYPLGDIPGDEVLKKDLDVLVESYQEYVTSEKVAHVPTIYQAPIKTDGGPIGTNYERTVKEGVSRDSIENICAVPGDQDTIKVWGNQKNTPANSGDYLLFAKREGRYSGEYTLLARIRDATVLDPDKAREFTDAVGWGEVTDRVFPHVMFLEPIYEADLDRETFWGMLDFKGWPNDTYSPIDFGRDGSKFYEEYSSIEGFLEEIKGQKVYPEDFGDLPPVDEYGSTEEAISDVRDRLVKTGRSDWLLHQLGEYLIREWSVALGGYKPSDEVSASSAATFDQLRSIYEELEPELESRADRLGVGSLMGFPPKKTFFLGWVRILQEDLSVEGGVLSQPRLNSILEDSYSAPNESKELSTKTNHPLTRHFDATNSTVYIFAAPPDFWLTTYGYAALGIEPDDQDLWDNLETGDVIIFYSRRKPGWESLDDQDAGILGAGIIQSKSTKPEDEIWWFNEQPDRPKSNSFPYLVTFDQLFASGNINKIDFSTKIFDKAVETVNSDLSALTSNLISFDNADAISSPLGDGSVPRHKTIISIVDNEEKYAIATKLAPTLETVPSVGIHKSFEGDLDSDVILDGLYFPDNQGEEIITQLEGALRAGKHAILTGPPGTGKTEIARRVSEYLAEEYPNLYSGSQVTTATADWSTFDTVGGYMPESNEEGSNDLSFTPGLILNRLKSRKSGAQLNEPIVIDELNRADIDKAFGQLFTLLSGQSVQLPYTLDGDEIELLSTDQINHHAEDHQYMVPESWRIFATMNTYDKTSLYEMSYAFMRRFAFIRVGAPTIPDDRGELEDLMHEYASVWDLQVEERDRLELYELGLVWRATNHAVKNRAIGPAIIMDMFAYLNENQYIDLRDRLTQAVISYIFPQLEGVPKREHIVRQIASVGQIDQDQLNAASKEMLQVSAIDDE